jgi:RNA-directed DNA polymerase
MRKSGTNLDAIAEKENLLRAFIATRKGKAMDPSMLSFKENLEGEIDGIYNGILNQTYAFGPYRSFRISDPKPRTIHAAPFRDRVVHHAIVQETESAYESHQIYDSYACRKQKGTHAAVLRAFHFAKSLTYYLRLDIRKYYDSIDHCILFKLLERKFRDPGHLFLLYRLLDSYHAEAGKGLPIGNLTSQYWANHYLASLDHFIKERMGTGRYVRYMDDMVLFSSTKLMLLEKRKAISGFLSQELKLDLKIAEIAPMRQGLPFLGFMIKPDRILLSKRSRDRFRTKMLGIIDDVENGVVSEDEAQIRSQSLVSFTLIARARRFRQSVLSSRAR